MRILQNLLLVALVAVSAVGCATRDHRDAPWDPKPGQSLHDVLPNWDRQTPCRPWTRGGETVKVCGGRVVGLWGGR